MNEQIPPGVRVKLKSGGPLMTVLDVGVHTGRLWCEWMTASGETRQHSFHPATLTVLPEGAVL